MRVAAPWRVLERQQSVASHVRRGGTLFYVQREPRSVWHTETPGDPEQMMCGERISVNLDSVRVQRRPGPKGCLWCQEYVRRALSLLQSSSSQSGTRTFPYSSRTEQPD